MGRVTRTREISEFEMIIEGVDCSRAGLGPAPRRGQKMFMINFNRPVMLDGGRLVWNVKFDGKDHNVADIDCRVPVCTRFRKTGPQPRAGLVGHAHKIVIWQDIAVIV